MGAQIFQFKQFTIKQDQCAMKVGTDGILLGAWASVSHPKMILDIGTGTGLLALMMAQRTQTAVIDAVELDKAAAEQAVENVAASPWSDRVHVYQTAVQTYFPPHQYDLIICNPPFWQPTTGTISRHMSRHTARHATTLSLEDLFSHVNRLLNAHGRFCCILPITAKRYLKPLSQKFKLFCSQHIEVKPIPAKPAHRLLLEFIQEERPCQTGTLVIENGRRHDYTDPFIALTQNFYLNF